MSLMQSGNTGRERGKKKRKNTSGQREDSFGTTGSLLGYHSLIAAVAGGVETDGEIAVHHLEYNQASTWLGS